MKIELRMLGQKGVIRSPFLETLDPDVTTRQYVLEVKWGYSEVVELEGPWKVLMSAIKTAVGESGITVLPNRDGEKLEGTDQQLLKMLEYFNPDKNTWSLGAQEWYRKLTPRRIIFHEEQVTSTPIASSLPTEELNPASSEIMSGENKRISNDNNQTDRSSAETTISSATWYCITQGTSSFLVGLTSGFSGGLLTKLFGRELGEKSSTAAATITMYALNYSSLNIATFVVSQLLLQG